MFNIGAGELFIIFLVAFFVVGPKDLPKVIKGVKGALIKIKALVKDLKAESGWDDIVKEVSDTGENVAGTFKSLDISKDLQDAQKSVEGSVKDLNLQQEFQEAKNALEKGMNALRSPVQSAAAAIKAELEPKKPDGAVQAQTKPEPAAAAVPDSGAPSAERKTGPEAEKTEEKK